MTAELTPRRRHPLITILAVAAALRVAIALLSIGSNDVILWQQFGREVWIDSFAGLWARDLWVNHPPLPVAYAKLVYALVGERAYPFSLLIKLPGLIADLAATALVFHVVRGRLSEAAARTASWLYAINPIALIIVGYHGNDDPVIGPLVLLTWYLADRGRPFAAGAAAGASVNVKVSPMSSLLLLLATARTWRESLRIVASLAVMAVPFALIIAASGKPFIEGVFGYRPMGIAWLTALPSIVRSHETIGPMATWLTMVHADSLVSVTLIWIAILAIRYRRRGGDRLVLGALFWSGLLAWGGGGLQYTIWPLALLAAVRPRLAFIYGIVGGLWLAASYASAWTGTFPPLTYFYADVSPSIRFLMQLPMIMLFVIAISLWREPTRANAAADAAD